MVRAPTIDQNGVRKGAWSEEEDNKLRTYVQRYGHWNWRQLPKFAGLSRCGKSCRLRWMNYLRPGVRRGNYSPQEEDLILELYRQFGSKWSLIAAKLPGRVDNDIKNHWHSHLRRKMAFKKPTDEEETNHECSSDFSSMSDYNVSSLSDDSTLVLQDCAADHQDSPTTSNMEHSFWPQSLATGTDGIDNLLHFQFPAAPSEEDITGSFASYLDGINKDCWLHELLQFEY